jgi:hypothetical protein
MPKFFTRIWQSVLFAFFAYGVTFEVFNSIIPAANTDLGKSLVLGGTICWIILGIIAVWFFFFHYRSVCCAGMLWIKALTNLTTILIFGSILMFALRLPFKGLRHDAITMGVPYVIGVILYFVQMWPCAKHSLHCFKNKIPVKNIMHDGLWDREEGMVWDFLDEYLLLRIIVYVLVIPGLLILCISLWLDIFAPLNISLYRIPVVLTLLQDMGNSIGQQWGNGIELLMPVIFVILSVLFFVALKVKLQTMWVLLTLVSLFGFFTLIHAFMNEQAFPYIVYDKVGLEAPADKLLEINTNGERERVYTARSDSNINYSIPTKGNSRNREVVARLASGETVTTTGRLATHGEELDTGMWAEVRYKDQTGWILNPRTHARTSWY